jgi:hypothetical protein
MNVKIPKCAISGLSVVIVRAAGAFQRLHRIRQQRLGFGTIGIESARRIKRVRISILSKMD